MLFRILVLLVFLLFILRVGKGAGADGVGRVGLIPGIETLQRKVEPVERAVGSTYVLSISGAGVVRRGLALLALGGGWRCSGIGRGLLGASGRGGGGFGGAELWWRGRLLVDFLLQAGDAPLYGARAGADFAAEAAVLDEEIHFVD